MKCLFLACLLAVVASALGSLIVGGDESVQHSRPYQVALFDWPTAEQSYFYCGGTLVHPKWVVSAAHCSGGAVYAGLGYHLRTKHGLADQEYIKGTWHVHPQYNDQTLDNDIALIELDTPATLNDNVKTIGITSKGPAEGDMLLVSGWGALYSGAFDIPEELREVKVTTSNQQACNTAYGGGITDNMFCAGEDGGGKDACQGDSGGPIVSSFGDGVHKDGTLLEGIVSWGYGCASPTYPGVYSNIYKFCSFISQATNNDVSCS